MQLSELEDRIYFMEILYYNNCHLAKLYSVIEYRELKHVGEI